MSSVATSGFTRTEFTGIREILSDELRPYPGRTETVARMVLACTVTTIVVMTFRIPFAFLGIFYAFVISRQKPEWLLRNGIAAVVASAAAVVYVAAGVQLFYDYDVLHFVFLVFTLYLVFFFKRALTNDSVTFGFGVTGTVALTLIWDRPEVDPIFWTRKQTFLRWWAALKMKESQCLEPARATHPA
jgi:multidrug resistance protein MdtO